MSAVLEQGPPKKVTGPYKRKSVPNTLELRSCLRAIVEARPVAIDVIALASDLNPSTINEVLAGRSPRVRHLTLRKIMRGVARWEPLTAKEVAELNQVTGMLWTAPVSHRSTSEACVDFVKAVRLACTAVMTAADALEKAIALSPIPASEGGVQ